MSEYKRSIYQLVKLRCEEPRHLIQVLIGPRQVGKTTLILQIAENLKLDYHYISADTAMLEGVAWLKAQWEIARLRAKQGEYLLIIDEVQKIPHWSEMIKQLWDEDTRRNLPLKVVMLGSSPWLIQTGVQESLAGRFEIIPVTHWSFQEMHDCFNWSITDYIYFGGYPGAAKLVEHDDVTRWKNYINDSLIETTLSRDILLITQVNKPALLRQLFQLGCIYSGQILSYQKMLGQLQEGGNTTTLSHYLTLLQGISLLAGVPKFAGETVRSRGSSPRFMVYNTALISAQASYNFIDAQNDSAYWGHLVESSVGSHILNSIRGTDIEVFYWREGNKEVDFILKQGEKVIALEVKSGKKKDALSGLTRFNEQYNPAKILTIGNQGMHLQEFLSLPISVWFE